MFIYQNKKNQICVTFKDNKPVDVPEYELEIKDDNLIVNGETFKPAVDAGEEEVFEPIEEEVAEDGAVDLGSFNGIEVVIPEENPSTPDDDTPESGDEGDSEGGEEQPSQPPAPVEPPKPVAVLKTDATLKVAPNVTFEIVPNTIDLAGHTLVIEGGEDSKVVNFEVKEDTEGKIVLKNVTVLGGEQ